MYITLCVHHLKLNLLFALVYVPGKGSAHYSCLQGCLINITDRHFQIVHILEETEATGNYLHILSLFCVSRYDCFHVIVSLGPSHGDFFQKEVHRYNHSPKVYLMAQNRFSEMVT